MRKKNFRSRTHTLIGDRNGQAFINVDAPNIAETGSEKVDQILRGASGADSDGGSAEPFKAEPALADKGAGVTAGFGVEVPEDLDD